MKILLCVYGSMRKREGNNAFLQGAKFLGPCKLKGELYNKDNSFAVLIDGDTDITAELYEIPQNKKALIDSLLKHMFVSKEVEVFIGNEKYIAHTYFQLKKNILGLRKIPSGDWKKR